MQPLPLLYCEGIIINSRPITYGVSVLMLLRNCAIFVLLKGPSALWSHHHYIGFASGLLFLSIRLIFINKLMKISCMFFLSLPHNGFLLDLLLTLSHLFLLFPFTILLKLLLHNILVHLNLIMAAENPELNLGKVATSILLDNYSCSFALKVAKEPSTIINTFPECL